MIKSIKELKLSKTSRIFLSAGIFIVIVGSLGLTRSQQLREQNQMDEELSVAQMRIDKLQVKHLQQQKEELQEKLDESILQLAASKDSLRQPVESIDVTDEFFAVAYSCGVEVVSISSSNIKNDELGDIGCFTTTLNAGVAGDVPDLISFVISLNNDFTTGIVKSAGISIEETLDDGKSSAVIMMVVYTYEGD